MTGVIHCGDCLEVLATLPDCSVNTCITSPPYWGLRDYGVDGQFGLEKTPDEYVAKMVSVFREVRRVLRDDGTLWLNLGDSYSGSWGNNGSRNGGQREKTTKKIDRKAWDNYTDRPASSFKLSGLKNKDLVGIPWMVAFALRADGWYLRQDIIWNKPNPMPESVTDRCTKSHEYIFLLAKSEKYYYDADAIAEKSTGQSGLAISFQRESKESLVPNQSKKQHRIDRSDGSPKMHGNIPGSDGGEACNKPGQETRNKRSVWTVTTKPFKGCHFATFPPDLIVPCVLAGCPEGGTVLDPFFGSGTTGLVAKKHGRGYIGIELNETYCKMAEKRLAQEQLL